jgi:hypothetical protein
MRGLLCQGEISMPHERAKLNSFAASEMKSNLCTQEWNGDILVQHKDSSEKNKSNINYQKGPQSKVWTWLMMLSTIKCMIFLD